MFALITSILFLLLRRTILLLTIVISTRVQSDASLEHFFTWHTRIFMNPPLWVITRSTATPCTAAFVQPCHLCFKRSTAIAVPKVWYYAALCLVDLLQSGKNLVDILPDPLVRS